MKKLKRLLRSPVGTGCLFALAALLLLVGSIGGARAALSQFSEDYVSHLPLKHIGIALYENGVDVSNDKLLVNLYPQGETLQPGRTYPEVLQVMNRGTIDEYVRVSIYRYWADAEGNKLRDLSPDLIELGYVNPSQWLMDQRATTRERTVLYYSTILAPGATSLPFTDTLTVNGSILDQVRTEDLGNGRLRLLYAYDGAYIALDVQADGVQTHNAAEAVHSAWGRQVSVSNGVLSLSSGQSGADGSGSGAIRMSVPENP